MNVGRPKNATPFARHRLLPEKVGQCRAAKENGSSISPVIEPAPIESEALSRFESEGGREAPVDVWVDVPLYKGVWRTRVRAYQTNQ
jgi:hypothetical protein